MGKPSVSQSVMELIEPAIREENLDLVDVEYKKEGKDWYLRVFIDKSQGVTVEDCQKVSRQIEDMIEVGEIIPSRYILEVSSPGLDRPLKKAKDFLRNVNRKIRVNAFSAINDQKNFTGVVKDFKDETLYLEAQGVTVAIPLQAIASAKLVIEF